MTHNPDVGDGIYVIKSIYDAVRVTCPDGRDVSEMDYYYVSIMRDDGYRTITFIVQEKSSAKDSGLYAVRNVLDQLKASGTYHSDDRGEKMGEYELAWIRDPNGLFYAYGWKHLSDDSLLLVEVLDGTATYDARELLSPAVKMADVYPSP